MKNNSPTQFKALTYMVNLVFKNYIEMRKNPLRCMENLPSLAEGTNLGLDPMMTNHAWALP